MQQDLHNIFRELPLANGMDDHNLAASKLDFKIFVDRLDSSKHELLIFVHQGEAISWFNIKQFSNVFWNGNAAPLVNSNMRDKYFFHDFQHSPKSFLINLFFDFVVAIFLILLFLL